MPTILPFVPSTNHYDFDTVLRSLEFKFEVRWNSRDEAFYFDVFAADKTRIATGLKVALGAYMGRNVNHELFRQGCLVCRIPQGDDRSNPRFDDMGTRVLVYYFTREEMAAEWLERLQGRGV